MINNITSIPTVILAGGKSQRLLLNNQRKWQLDFGGQSLLDVVIHRLRQQTNTIIINGQAADSADLSATGLPLIYDESAQGNVSLNNVKGPIAGLIAAISWAKAKGHPWVATVPCDTPFFPDNLLATLSLQVNKHKTRAAIAQSKTQRHAVFGLWSIELFDQLISAVTHDNIRAIRKWAALCACTVNFPYIQRGDNTIDPFFNINTPKDYRQALHYLK
ncbi:MAG: molybdenum cofactor guanylyltransferase [Cellvibrionaceae bacterium]